jgi:hypothetical protein
MGEDSERIVMAEFIVVLCGHVAELYHRREESEVVLIFQSKIAQLEI